MTYEKAIIARVLAGDREAFRLLVKRYQGPVILMVACLANDRLACEDIAQEVLLAAYRARRRLTRHSATSQRGYLALPGTWY